MELLNNLGICYKGDYISQGSQNDKCKKSVQLGIKNTEFIVRKDGKNMDFENISKIYSGFTIFHLPAVDINQANLKELKEDLSIIMKNKIDLITIDASNLLFETFDWSTEEEQQNYLKNMSKGLATIASHRIPIAIENPDIYKNSTYFGKTISNISDLILYTRNALVEQFEINRDIADNLVGVSINVSNLIRTSEIVDLSSWIKVFNNDIMCVKVSNIENSIPLFSQLLDLIIDNNIDVPLLLETKEEIESISNEYRKFEHLVKNKIEGKPLNFNNYTNIMKSRYNEYNYSFNSAQSGYTNIIIISMILLTAIIAVLMIMVQLKS